MLSGDKLNKWFCNNFNNKYCDLYSPRRLFLCDLSLRSYSCLSLFFSSVPLSSLLTFATPGVLRLFCFHLCRWPRTLAGITAYLQCSRNIHGSGIYPGSSQDERKAWRRCDRGGFWADDDYSRCQYANDVTRVLYMFNQVTIGHSGSPGLLMNYSIF